MIEFIEFDTFEEAQQKMQEFEDRANANLLPAQERLRDSYDQPVWWMRPTEDFIEWGQAWTNQEAHASSVKSGCTPQEALDETTSIIEARGRGYLFGMSYAIIEPRGTLGTTHVALAIPVTEQVFNLAKDSGWKVESGTELHFQVGLAIAVAVREGEEQ